MLLLIFGYKNRETRPNTDGFAEIMWPFVLRISEGIKKAGDHLYQKDRLPRIEV